ncbi:TraR/DksA C4-type zinc finger protein [Pasteurella multocida subsp. multocida]|uniref:TraR/DksA C4-type zinc finger protein n=1 Tax=Pasteurella multocida TaxID=747 RepID=A0A9X3ZM26_PASMD|nr:TraR/DksA C4-type zinc finger protein [Pasteurella multocida]MBF6981630.1 TraR/DksA C4-type zinc finger protein [Pasteurella multocida]MDA5611783.1 TraR/DksA C4-type zinc finger protein [Pasteurella multocida]MDA5614237.1 TraR/DksA C4-type zinc finger protein [Pasteurella multocida]MDA5619335.1 TraR/DksA C4-type zinc finger protein [Pasteurella multocida subsp. multocida]MDA5621861.1 TraR/DksA C4-type zinc finger protein [Pasteurella multocida subsp. multocida]
MDRFDKAQELEQMQRDLAIQNRTTSTRASAFFCEDCGEEIPEIRRLTILGVFRCVTCQTIFEKKQRVYRR